MMLCSRTARTISAAVLEGLDDAAQLVSAYTGRPTYQIGPDLSPIYQRFVPRLIAIVDRRGTIQIAFWATLTVVFLE